ncbi:MAG: hypothetical protein GF384_00185 [Elusimicrobia bacterium]|nr:hypothetical protein [Elusimicrobiota bacterium]MBD3411514.1 hypothetical protein [Elusimicrobiota bacterium]
MRNVSLWMCLGTLMCFSAGCAGGRKMVRTFSGDPGQQIEAEGIAPIVDGDLIAARKAALADAQKNAVEKVVGVYVTAQTRVEKAVTIESNILARTEGYITQYDVLKEKKDAEFYRITIKAIVKLQEISEDLDELGLLATAKEVGYPRVSIIIQETVNDEISEAGSAEMALFKALIDYGYPVVESTQISEQDVERALDGNASFYTSIGEQLKVEILVIGTVSAQLVTSEGLGGFMSYRATANLKAIRTNDAKILLTTSDVQSGVDITDDAAAQKALQAVGKKAGVTIAEDIASSLKRQSVIGVTIAGVESIETVNEFKRFFEGLSEVDIVQVRTFSSAATEIDLYLSSGTPQDIAERLTKTSTFNVTINSVSAFEIAITVQP